MLRKFHFEFGDMALALALWICSLPLVALLIVPILGLKAGLIVAAGLFFAALTVCWGVCAQKIFKASI